jgi:hypothetical protein
MKHSMESARTISQLLAAFGRTLPEWSRKSMSTASQTSQPVSRRSRQNTSVLMRREHAMFLEDMEIETALSAGSGVGDSGDLADVAASTHSGFDFDGLLGADIDPIAGREAIQSSLAAFSVSDMEWVLAEFEKRASVSSKPQELDQVALGFDALEIPLAD